MADTVTLTPYFPGIPGRGERKQGRSHIQRDDGSEFLKLI